MPKIIKSGIRFTKLFKKIKVVPLQLAHRVGYSKWVEPKRVSPDFIAILRKIMRDAS